MIIQYILLRKILKLLHAFVNVFHYLNDPTPLLNILSIITEVLWMWF